jgi:hypothetical protein
MVETDETDEIDETDETDEIEKDPTSSMDDGEA